MGIKIFVVGSDGKPMSLGQYLDHFAKQGEREATRQGLREAALRAQAAADAQQAAAGTGDSQPVLGQVYAAQQSNIAPLAPDVDTRERDIVAAAATIAGAFVGRNLQKHGDRGQYSTDSIVRLSVEMAEKIHARVHATE